MCTSPLLCDVSGSCYLLACVCVCVCVCVCCRLCVCVYKSMQTGLCVCAFVYQSVHIWLCSVMLTSFILKVRTFVCVCLFLSEMDLHDHLYMHLAAVTKKVSQHIFGLTYAHQVDIPSHLSFYVSTSPLSPPPSPLPDLLHCVFDLTRRIIFPCN